MKVRTRPLLLAAAVLAGTVVPLAAPAAADSGPVPLGMAALGSVVADEAHGRLFLSGGPTGDGIRVTDLSGTPVATLGFRGAAGMALSPDGSTLWVAQPEFGLVQLDTASLTAKHRIDLPPDQCPGDVAVVGDRVVYGYSCDQYLPGGSGYGGIGVVDAVTGSSYGTVTTGPSYRPLVEAGPNGRVYAADAGLSPTGLHLVDVTGSTPRVQRSTPSVCSNLQDLSAAPLGDHVVTACGGTYEHEVWSLTLDRVGSYSSGPYPVAGAWAGDGSTFAAGLRSAYEPDLYLYRTGSGAAEQAVRQVDFGSTASLLQPRGLAASYDGRRVWAVTSTSSDTLALHVIDVPLPGSSVLSVGATPQALYAGQPTTLTGRLADVTGAPVAGVALSVQRAATGAAPTSLEPVVTAADGSFRFVDTPPTAGSWAYTVTHPADAAVAQTTVLAWATDTRLTLDVKPDGAGVYGVITLRYDGPEAVAGRTVTLTRTGGGLVTPLPPVTIDSWGGGKFLDSPGPGTWSYTAAVAASGVHPAATATSTVTLPSPVATTLTVDVPVTATAGTPLPVTGTLTAAGAPVPSATVTVRRADCGSVSWTRTGTTTPNGAWSVTDTAPPAGPCTYTASYAGSTLYAASAATASTTVSLRPTSLTALAPAGLAGSPLTVSGKLSSGTAALGGATVSVVRSGCTTTTWPGSATTAADGSWSVTDPTPPGGTCTYRATFAGTAVSAPADASASTTVARRETSLSLSVVRGTGKKPNTVTGLLGTTHTNRTLTVTAQPVGGAETVVVSAGQVDSAGRLTVTHVAKTGTTYRVKFSGDAWYAPTTVQAVQ